MNKPNNYENTQAGGMYTPIELGGHVCQIIKVEEAVTRTGKEMLKIYLNTAQSDKQPQFYGQQYKADTRLAKKWGCIYYLVTTDNMGNCSKSFKGFCTAVESSNSGFKIPWGNNFCEGLKNKAVGAIFGEEEYQDNWGDIKVSRKPFFFCDVERVPSARIPNKRTLDGQQQYQASPQGFVQQAQSQNINTEIGSLDEYEDIISDGEVPF